MSPPRCKFILLTMRKKENNIPIMGIQCYCSSDLFGQHKWVLMGTKKRSSINSNVLCPNEWPQSFLFLANWRILPLFCIIHLLIPCGFSLYSFISTTGRFSCSFSLTFLIIKQMKLLYDYHVTSSPVYTE